MTRNDCGRLARSRWLVPATCAVLGGAVLAAGLLGGHVALGVTGLAIMAGLGLLVALAGGSETIRGLRGDGRDERFARIDLQATAVAGLALIVAVIVAWLVQVARGHDGSPYDWLGAIGGLSYALATAYLRWRGLSGER